MRYALLGAGMMGSACAKLLLKWDDTSSLTIIEKDEKLLGELLNNLSDIRVMGSQGSIETPESLARNIEGADVCISAVPYALNPLITEACISSSVNMCDMGGNHDVVEKQLSLSEKAQETDITIIPDCGLAPGLGNILTAKAISELDTTDTIRLRVGGLPVNPVPPFNYQLLFSIEGLINEYTEDCKILKDGKIEWVKPLQDLEEFEFNEDFSNLEAFNTSGGSSTLPDTYEGTVKNLDYKTLRYPGHSQLMKGVMHLASDSQNTIEIQKSVRVSPKDLITAMLRKKLPAEGEDIVLMYCEAVGEIDNKPVRLIKKLMIKAKPSSGLSAMMIGTALPTVITARFLASGEIEKKGVISPEIALPTDEFLQTFKSESGIEIEETVEEINP